MSHLSAIVRAAAWRKSTFCNGAATCVEVAMLDGLVVVRDAKDPYGAVLVYSQPEWSAFLDGVRAGEFDVEALAARSVGDGSGVDGNSRGPVGPYAAQESSPVSQ